MRSDHSERTAAALRSLCQRPASIFGQRVLARAQGELVSFRDFVRVARDMIKLEPDATAAWLAALVALDMTRDDSPRRQQTPSPN